MPRYQYKKQPEDNGKVTFYVVCGVNHFACGSFKNLRNRVKKHDNEQWKAIKDKIPPHRWGLFYNSSNGPLVRKRNKIKPRLPDHNPSKKIKRNPKCK